MRAIYSLLILILLLACGSGNNDVTELEEKIASMEAKLKEVTKERDPERYYNDDLNISVKNLKDWEIKENYQDIPVFFMSPTEGEEDTFQENINMVSENAPGYSLKEYYDANIAGINQYLIGFEIIKDAVDIKINNHDFKKMVYKHNSQGYDFKVLVFFTVKGGKGYVINCTALNNTFDEYYSDFNKLAESFKFE